VLEDAIRECVDEGRRREAEAELGYVVESSVQAVVELVIGGPPLLADGASSFGCGQEEEEEEEEEGGGRVTLCPEDAERAEGLAEDPEPLRAAVAEQVAGAFEGDDEVCGEVCDAFVKGFLGPVLGPLVDAAWAEVQGEEQGSEVGKCELCERVIPTTRHHLVPKSQHKYHRESRGRTIRELSETVALCRPCHSGIHRLIDEREMGLEYATLDRLRAHPGVARHVAWVGKQPVGGKTAAWGRRGAHLKDARAHR